MDSDKTIILIAVTGYEEILGQLKADDRLSRFEAVPSIYLESLYEDMLLLSVKKQPLNYRKKENPVIPNSFMQSGFLAILCRSYILDVLSPGKNMLPITR